MSGDVLARLIAEAFAAVCEAEKYAYAGGMRRTVGKHLIEAHTALMKARDAR